MQFHEVEAEEVDDGYIPPQENYLPPGLQEHEDILSQTSQDDLADVTEDGNDPTEEAEGEEVNEDILDDEDEEDKERSWKRRNNEDDWTLCRDQN